MIHAAIQTLPWRDPGDALAPFAEEPHALLFGGPGEPWTYLLRHPARVLDLGPRDNAFAALAVPHVPADPDGPPFQGGWAGLACYELGAQAEPVALPRHPDWPDLHAGLYLQLLAFDRRQRRVLAVGRGDTSAEARTRAAEAAAWLQASAPPASRAVLAADITASSGPAYEAAVAQVVARIEAGEIFQANVARRWTGRLTPGAAPHDLLRRLAAASPAPLAAYYRLPGRAVVSNSPERFLRVDADGAVEARPIKGTRPRSPDPRIDAALAADLAADPKDRAENLMIVDLMRNDLSRVCRPGSVKAPDLFRLESFANVHHLVSTVTGRLRPGVGPAEVLRAAFPPGSITGAPKVQAMKVIAALEAPRGPYCGSLFWAGLVADSDPRLERLETEAKIDAIRRALTEPPPARAEAAE